MTQILSSLLVTNVSFIAQHPLSDPGFPTVILKFILPAEILSPATYEKIGIHGTINMETGEVYSSISETFNSDTFLDFIKNLVQHIPHGKKFVMILDNARPHHAKKVTQYVEKHVANLEFLFLPPYSPDLNPSENVWKLLRRNATHNVYFDSLTTLVDKVTLTLNDFSKPSQERLKYCAVI